MVVTALSISRPLTEELKVRPFTGRAVGRFERACNLVDGYGRVIALTLPEVGNGPFSVVVDGWPGCFESLAPAEPAIANSDRLSVGSLHLDLTAVPTWNPRLVFLAQPLSLNTALTGILQPYTAWPDREVGPALSRRLAQMAARLNQAVIQASGEDGEGEVAAAASQLAGLGNGLTPAGDDFLLGVMAALWMIGSLNLLSPLATAAIPRTTALSAAFLKAAAQGEFIEPWHELAQALCTGEVELVRWAVEKVARFGATSGRDALAGFTTTLLIRRLI